MHIGPLRKRFRHLVGLRAIAPTCWILTLAFATRAAESEVRAAEAESPESNRGAPPAVPKAPTSEGQPLDSKEQGESPAQSGLLPQPQLPGIGELLPVQLTAFGDIRYALAQDARDRFSIGSLELDASLTLTPYLITTTAIAYDVESNGMALASFTVDGGLFGRDQHHLWRSDWIVRSGVVFGRFDVPFGTAYLEYPSTAARLVTLPASVMATHHAWNDIGIQAYAETRYFNVIAYFLNGRDYQATLSDGSPDNRAASFSLGGRVGLLAVPGLEIGSSLALDRHEEGHQDSLFGADLALLSEHFDFRGEYLVAKDGALIRRGSYGRAAFLLDPGFLLARYDVVVEGDAIQSKILDLGAGLKVFKGAEARIVCSRGFEDGTLTGYLQMVGGQSFQPTGFRR
ncbi:MAG TPA: hypothetical protein VFQ61_22640 [Polyangiaceae bacterium]|nr:hypothetical protein [Polyangiaceae bacterium]